MTIDEIKKAKEQAEQRILAEMQASQDRVESELNALKETTGMEVMPLQVTYIECLTIDGQHKIISGVRIELRIP